MLLNHYIVLQNIKWAFLQVSCKGVQWRQMVSNGVKWCPMASNGVQWRQMVSNGVQWCPMASNGVQWRPTGYNLSLISLICHSFL